jgi:dinuclear metal center YbgI/SA1388 family protein
MTMTDRQHITRYLDDLLQVSQFNDYCPNGLQIEGRKTIARLVSGVTANQALIEAAVEQQADALLVHHGYFWKGEAPCITGLKRERIARLLENNINLLAYHLPLDAHPDLGNNAQLAKKLGLQVEGTAGDANLIWYGRLPEPCAAAELATHIGTSLARAPLYIEGGEGPISRVAWCTGAAQGYIEEAATLGVQAFISGEISEQTVHVARELGLNYFSAGHHATERYGVQSLGEHLAEYFGIQHTFVDIDNPV